MRKTLTVITVLIAVVGLIGCGDTRTDGEKYEDCMKSYSTGPQAPEGSLTNEQRCYIVVYN